MLRLSELRLPLDHAEADLRAAVRARLGIGDADLLGVTIFRRAVDARKKSAILLAYALDLELRDEAAVLARLARDPNVRPAPDTSYNSSPAPSPRPGTARW